MSFLARPRQGFLRRSVEFVCLDTSKGLKKPTQLPALPQPSSRAGHQLYVLKEQIEYASFLTGLAGTFFLSASILQGISLAIGAVAIQRLVLRRGFGNQLDCNDLAGKVCIVTGASSGIGAALAAQLAINGAEVICTTRGDPAKAKEHIASEYIPAIVEETRFGGATRMASHRLHCHQLELGSFRSVKSFAEWVQALPVVKEKGIHVLVNNAGLWKGGAYSRSMDGDEVHVGCNFLGPVYLTELLLPHIVRARDSQKRQGGRVINVSSVAHTFVNDWWLDFYDHKITNLLEETGRKPIKATKAEKETILGSEKKTVGKDPRQITSMHYYGLSKLCQIYHTDHLVQRGVCAVSVHPGGVTTGVFREVAPKIGSGGWITTLLNLLFFRTPAEAAEVVFNCAVRPDICPGGYYSSCRLQKHGKSLYACDETERREVMEWALKKVPAGEKWIGKKW